MERRKASACLSRIGRAVTAVQASEKEREADSNVIKDAVKPLLRFQPDAGGAGGVVDDSKGAFAFCACAAEISTECPGLRVLPAYCFSLPLVPGLFC